MVSPSTEESILYVPTQQLIADTSLEHWMTKVVCWNSPQHVHHLFSEELLCQKNFMETPLYASQPEI